MEKITNNYALYNPDVQKRKSKGKDKSEKSKKSAGLFSQDDSFDSILTEQIAAPGEFQTLVLDDNEAELETLLQDIGVQGKALKRSQNLDEFIKYKNKVKQFLNLIVNLSESVEQKTLWNRFKKDKVTKIHLTIINNELLELSRMFMNTQKDAIKIGAKLDRIEGLLVDMKF